MDHRQLLHQKFKEGKFEWAALSADEIWFYHSYVYAWRRVFEYLGSSPIDPDILWFDQSLVDDAEVMLRRKFNKPKPPASRDRTPPTPEEIAHVERCTRQIVANLASFDERNRSAFGLRRDEEREALRKVREQLGVMAKEQVE